AGGVRGVGRRAPRSRKVELGHANRSRRPAEGARPSGAPRHRAGARGGERLLLLRRLQPAAARAVHGFPAPEGAEGGGAGELPPRRRALQLRAESRSLRSAARRPGTDHGARFFPLLLRKGERQDRMTDAPVRPKVSADRGRTFETLINLWPFM